MVKSGGQEQRPALLVFRAVYNQYIAHSRKGVILSGFGVNIKLNLSSLRRWRCVTNTRLLESHWKNRRSQAAAEWIAMCLILGTPGIGGRESKKISNSVQPDFWGQGIG
jgi:hypothetical protein